MKKIISNWHDVLRLYPGNKFPEYPSLAGIELDPLGNAFFRLDKWSNLVIAEGDKSLANDMGKSYPGPIGWIKKDLFWKKLMVLQVIGEHHADYVVGFYSSRFNLCKVSDRRRNVWLGHNKPFAMRVGPDDIGFFVVSNSNEPLELRSYGYIDGDMELF